MTSSTMSSESAPRSSRKEDSFLISASLTPSCSATIFLTRCSMLSMQISKLGKFPRIIAKQANKVSAVEKKDWGDSNPPPTQSSHINAAVAVQRRTGNFRRLGACQEGHCVGDIGRLAHATQGNLRKDR